MVARLQFILYTIALLCSILLFTSVPNILLAQEMGLKDPTVWTSKFDKTTDLKVGDIITLMMETAIPPEYHVYSTKPPSKPGPNPTFFQLDKEARDIVAFGGCMDALTPEKHYDDVFETDVYYFHNRSAFIQKFRITGNNPKVVGVLKYQYCTEVACQYGSEEIDKSFVATSVGVVAKTDTATKSSKGDSTEKKNPPVPPPNDNPDDSGNSNAGGSYWLLFFKTFAFGLVSLITPCVFPMIPMTVTFFTKRSRTRSEGIRNAFIYSASLIAIFVGLGLGLTIIFGGAALYNIATNPWVNVAMFAIIFTFGLSFLGMFEISLPSSWTNKLDQKSDQGGILGIFFMALLLVVASFSCIGPIAGYILVDAASGQVAGPLVGMTGYAMGFALPFGIFAMFPGWMQSLPKSGGWLNSVKVTLGFIEIALCFKFLSNADLILQWHILNREVFLSIWIAVFGVLGVYLLGKLRLPHDSVVEKISAQRSVLSVACFAFTFYLLPGLFGAPLPLLSGILPPPNQYLGVKVVGGNSNNGNTKLASNQGICGQDRKHSQHLSQYAPEGYCMFYDLDEAQAYAKKVNKPIFIDFTGHSCANCRQMEHKVWPDEQVKNLLTNDYIMASLYVDDQTPLKETIKLEDGTKLRTEGDKWLHLQKTEYKLISQPYYMLVNPEGKPLVNKGVGYTPDIPEYIKFLQSGLKKFNSNAEVTQR